jgi:PAS domain S-box-containing protein
MKYKTGIQRKITLMICFSILIIMAIGISLGCFSGFNLIKDVIGTENQKATQILASHINEILNGELNDLHTYSANPRRKEFIVENNSNYQTFTPEVRKGYFTYIDKQWKEAKEDDPLLKEYLENPVARGLKEIAKINNDIAEIRMTNEFGSLVAGSHKTESFYQSDAKWWQEAYDGGRGKDFIGEAEFDTLSNIWVVPMAVPIRDDDNKVIGICKAAIDLNRFFSHLEGFKVGNTGQAFLFDGTGNVVFYRGIKPLSAKFCSETALQKLLKNKKKYEIIAESHLRKEKVLIAYAELKNPLLLKEGIVWRVGLSQDVKEVFAPLSILIFQMIALILLLLVVMLPIAFLYSGMIARPIKKLHATVEQVMKGNWDYKIEVKTGDEIEQFADAFREMLSNIKDKQEKLKEEITERKLKEEELREYRKHLEELVEKRTAELKLLNEQLQQDITERKKIGEALRKSEEQFRLLVEETVDYAIFMLDPAGYIVTWNKGAERIKGYKAEEVIGKHFSLFYTSEDIQRGWPEQQLKKAEAEGRCEDEGWRIRKDGSRFLGNVVITALHDGTGNLYGFSKLTRDITERKKAEEELRDAYNKLKDTQTQLIQSAKMASIGQLASGVAHEINNPLTGVLNSIQLIKEGIGQRSDSSFDAFKEILDNIEESATRCKTIIWSLLDFSRSSRGPFSLLPLNEIIEKATVLIGREMQLEKINLEKQFQTDLPQISGDAQLLQQVIFNLLSNARWAIQESKKEGGIITLKTQYEPEKNITLLSISDNGIGILKENLDKIFDPFFSTKQVGKGTGLGLSIAYNIIKEHKGSLEVESQPGKGTTFKISLPCILEKAKI